MTTDWTGLRIGVYVRYSTEGQNEESNADQLRVCTRLVEQRGGTVRPDLIFGDKAISGASLQRDGFEALMRAAEAKPRRIDLVVVEDVSRVTRDFADWGNVVKRLRFVGVELVSVQEGISTSDRHAKFSLGLKAIVAEEFIDNLRDKTRRGMEGRALRGLSTGLLPIGYRSTPITDAGGTVAYSIEIDAERAATVLSIFERWVAGQSYSAIAKWLNDAGVTPPRGNGRRRIEGWVASGVRAILYNPKYIGDWTWNRRIFIKKPGTNQRVSRLRPDADLVRQTFEDRRIVPPELWLAAQARLSASKTKYAGGRADQRGRPTPHLLSGILVCDECDSVMTLHGGNAGRRYYRCDARAKRGTCDNAISVREDIARPRILAALRELLISADTIATVREQVIERLAQRDRAAATDVGRARAELARVEEKIGRLVQFITEGSASKYVGAELKTLEARAAELQQEVAASQAARRAPVTLPTLDVVVERVLDLRRLLERDALAGREALRSLLLGGAIRVDRQLVARGRVFPLAAFVGSSATNSRPPTETKRPPQVSQEAAGSEYKAFCGGRICRRSHGGEGPTGG